MNWFVILFLFLFIGLAVVSIIAAVQYNKDKDNPYYAWMGAVDNEFYIAIGTGAGSIVCLCIALYIHYRHTSRTEHSVEFVQ